MAYVCDPLQRCQSGWSMRPALLLVLLAGLLLLVYFDLAPRLQGVSGDQVIDALTRDATSNELLQDPGAVPQGTVLDISVHSLDELKVLLDRAEEIAARPQSQGKKAGVVLVLHGPEVEFFAISNYPRYKDIVDQAARLDAFDVVDVKICQSMLDRQGIDRDDIPAFIEQVPSGPGEVERLVREGYVYF
jgi:intracellular sulfur oxidation DsrE/DsrF family protein